MYNSVCETNSYDWVNFRRITNEVQRILQNINGLPMNMQYGNHISIYTDGSKGDAGVGAAAVSESRSLKQHL